ncbi:hypothetical protein [Mycolicibacterium palauense]|uniref:hypothetical protein n=1 Tax=Mycolicibacterium palauense TaxID=2034511 RepID=UPI001145B998|nr:hypothetical protein [Mycolicibacterium palauense]
MIAVIERPGGVTIAHDGQVVGHFTIAEADDLRAKLTDALNPVNTAAVTPAKARMRPPILRYPAGIDQ